MEITQLLQLHRKQWRKTCLSSHNCTLLCYFTATTTTTLLRGVLYPKPLAVHFIIFIQINDIIWLLSNLGEDTAGLQILGFKPTAFQLGVKQPKH